MLEKKHVVRSIIIAAAFLMFCPARILHAEELTSLVTDGRSYFIDFDDQSASSERYALELPVDGMLYIDYGSHYFQESLSETDCSACIIRDSEGTAVFSLEKIEGGTKLFSVDLPAGLYEMEISSNTKHGRVRMQLYHDVDVLNGTVKASALTHASEKRKVYLSGDVVLDLDTDITVEDFWLIGTPWPKSCTLTVTGMGTLTITREWVSGDINLEIRSGTVDAPAMSNFRQYGGKVRISGGRADSFVLYGGQLFVETEGDGLTGAFEVRGGEVTVNAGSCGIHTELLSGTAHVYGGKMTICGGKRAILTERVYENADAPDNVGYYTERYEIPIYIAPNVTVVSPQSGWTREGKTEYTFPESIGEVRLEAVVVPGWNEDASGWWYRNEDGTWSKSTWAKIDGRYYYFNEKGYMQSGWLKKDGNWYYLGIPGNRNTGFMREGWLKVGNTWYYLKDNGAMATGWVKVNGKWYWLNTPNGDMAKGWKQVSGVWYFLDKTNGDMKTGWVKDGSYWYFLNGNGSMRTGWLKHNGSWYWLKGTGAMASNETVLINGKNYNFASSGACTNP